MKLSHLKQIIKEEIKRLSSQKSQLKEGVKVVPREKSSPGPKPPCCCEEKFDPWSQSWVCLQMGTQPGQCCGSTQQWTGKGHMGEGAKVKPKEKEKDFPPCCCHTVYNSECGWDCVPGATWHKNCCPSKAGMVAPPSGPGVPMGPSIG